MVVVDVGAWNLVMCRPAEVCWCDRSIVVAVVEVEAFVASVFDPVSL